LKIYIQVLSRFAAKHNGLVISKIEKKESEASYEKPGIANRHLGTIKTKSNFLL